MGWLEQKAEVATLSEAATAAADRERNERSAVIQHSRESTSRLKFLALASVAGIVVWSLLRRKKDPEERSQKSLVVQAGLAALTIQRWHHWLEHFRQVLRHEGREGKPRREAVAAAKD